jgi:hypothetical protein
MQPIVFNKAGKILLKKYVNGVPTMEKSLSRMGVVQQITPNISINGTPIEDGNSLWDAANLDTGIEATIAVQLGYMPTELYAFIMGDESKVLATADFPVIDEEIVVPETSPYEVTLKHTPNADGVQVVDIHNTAFKAGTTTPAEGEYILAEDKLTFHKDDAGKALFVTYYYSASNVTNFGLPKTPVRPAYQLVITGEAQGEDETLYEVATTVDKCKVLGNINPPQQGGTPTPVTITFTVLKPRGTNKAVDYMAVPIEVPTEEEEEEAEEPTEPEP